MFNQYTELTLSIDHSQHPNYNKAINMETKTNKQTLYLGKRASTVLSAQTDQNSEVAMVTRGT